MGIASGHRRFANTTRGVHFSHPTSSAARFPRFLRWIASLHAGALSSAGPAPLLRPERPAHPRALHRGYFVRIGLLFVGMVADHAGGAPARRDPPIGRWRSLSAGWRTQRAEAGRGGRPDEGFRHHGEPFGSFSQSTVAPAE